MNETFLVTLQFFLSDEPCQFLVCGSKELSNLTNLLSNTDRYSIVAIESLGKMDSLSDLITDLINGQRPQGMDFGSGG